MKRSLKVAAVILSFFAIADMAMAQNTIQTPQSNPGDPQQGNPPSGGGSPAAIQNAPPTGGGGSGSILEAAPGGGVLDGVYTPEHLPFRKPIPYVYEREADIMWQKRVWRVIDLREKINHPLYYPDNEDMAKRPSLFHILQDGIQKKKIKTVFFYDAFTTNSVSQ